MKRILISAGLMLGAVAVYTPIANAVAPTYTIDCSADTDLSRDNTDTEWVVYTTAVEVLTTNCAYSCAAGGTDQNISCGSAWSDSYSDRTFSVTGTGWIHAYDPGFYGKTLYFGVDASQMNFSATPGVHSITFHWDSIEHADIYFIEATDVVEPDGIKSSTLNESGQCRVDAPANSCTIEDLLPGVSHQYAIAVHFDWDQWQDDVAAEWVSALAPATTTTTTTTTLETTTTDASVVTPTLAVAGGTSESKFAAAILMIALGIAASFVLRRRIPN